MNHRDKPPRLLQLLDVDEVAAADRLRHWAQAFDQWLEERSSRVSLTTSQISYTAWREFLNLIRKPPWEGTAADVEAYIAALEKRKLRPGTITCRLAALSQFYKYCQANRVDPQCEAAFNPVASARKPESQRYEKANYLSKKEEAALLQAVRRDPSPMGKRDYALLLMLLRTGWQAGVVRQLMWEELRHREKGDKEGGERGVLPGEVWEALRESLEATGRRQSIRPQDYVFAPSRDPLLREARDGAQDWDGGRPLSDDQLLKLLRRHAGQAGLKADKITTRTLRSVIPPPCARSRPAPPPRRWPLIWVLPALAM